jgi:hypothetical protein
MRPPPLPLLLLAVAAAARGAAASFACCTAAACAAASPPACCAGLYDATTNDAAQCVALAALYAAAGGAGWHLSSDWTASKAGSYGGAHNVEGQRIVVRAENAPTVEGDIFNMLLPSGAELEPPGHGYDYYDFWKYDYAVDATWTETTTDSYYYTDDGAFVSSELSATILPLWPNAALFNCRSTCTPMRPRAAGRRPRTARPPTFAPSTACSAARTATSPSCACARERVGVRARAFGRARASVWACARAPTAGLECEAAHTDAVGAAPTAVGAHAGTARRQGSERQRKTKPSLSGKRTCARSSADVHAAPCAARRAASCRATTWWARCRLSSSTCRTSFTCAFYGGACRRCVDSTCPALTRRLPGRDSNLKNNTLSGAIPALPTSLQYLCAPLPAPHWRTYAAFVS